MSTIEPTASCSCWMGRYEFEAGRWPAEQCFAADPGAIARLSPWAGMSQAVGLKRAKQRFGLKNTQPPMA